MAAWPPRSQALLHFDTLVTLPWMLPPPPGVAGRSKVLCGQMSSGFWRPAILDCFLCRPVIAVQYAPGATAPLRVPEALKSPGLALIKQIYSAQSPYLTRKRLLSILPANVGCPFAFGPKV